MVNPDHLIFGINSNVMVNEGGRTRTREEDGRAQISIFPLLSLSQIHSCYLNLIFLSSLFHSAPCLSPFRLLLPIDSPGKKHTYSILKLFMQMYITHLSVFSTLKVGARSTYFSDSIRLMIRRLATSWIKFRNHFYCFLFFLREFSSLQVSPFLMLLPDCSILLYIPYVDYSSIRRRKWNTIECKEAWNCLSSDPRQYLEWWRWWSLSSHFNYIIHSIKQDFFLSFLSQENH